MKKTEEYWLIGSPRDLHLGHHRDDVILCHKYQRINGNLWITFKLNDNYTVSKCLEPIPQWIEDITNSFNK